MDALCIEARAKLEKSQNCQPAGRHRTPNERRRNERFERLPARHSEALRKIREMA